MMNIILVILAWVCLASGGAAILLYSLGFIKVILDIIQEGFSND